MHAAGETNHVSETRTRNMEKRRQRILEAARAIIIDQGIDGLTTRGLAKAAGVTAPTLYNLIGGKEEILRTMISQGVEKVWARLNFESLESPLDMAERIIEQAAQVVDDDADYFRAMILGADRIIGSYTAQGDLVSTASVAGQRSIEMAATACAAAISQGLLRGNLPAAELGQQMFICYRGPVRDWAYGLISREETKRRTMRGFYLVMAADASPDFRDLLVEKAKLLEAESPACIAA